MIGDRSHDLVGAASNRLAVIGLLYGYGSQEELFRAGARTLVARVDELGAALDALS